MSGALYADPARAGVRAVRAGVLTAVAVGLAAAAHSAAGDCISWAGVATATALSWPAAVVALGRRRSVASLAGWLLVVQVVTYVVLDAFCTSALTGAGALGAHLQESLTPRALALHAGSALVAGLVLGRADARLWTARALTRAAARAYRLVRALPPLVQVVTAPVQPPLPEAPVLR
ncbi:MAG: hypothetical protein ACXVFU_15590, partial [Nocardioidaceae bacterium]